jgi:aryl-alcohol dehydrogenase-like predicted oxidoreductase
MRGEDMPSRTDRTVSRRRFLSAAGAALAGFGARSGVLSGRSGDKGAGGPAQPRIQAFRPLGRTGFRVSDIAFGSSYLTDPAILEAALDAGINYIDCAEVYLGGQVERTVGRVLTRRPRKSVFLTTKIVLRPGETRASVKSRALKCLDRLGLESVDCFMMHAAPTVAAVGSAAFHQAVSELKAEGRVRFTGLSNHGSYYFDAEETMDKVVLAAAADGRFDILTFAYNFLQREMGERILAACREKKLGAVVIKTNPVLNYLKVRGQVEARLKEGRRPEGQWTTLLGRLQALKEKAGPFLRGVAEGDTRAVRAAGLKYVLSEPGVSAACVSIGNTDDLRAFVELSGRTLASSEARLLGAYGRTLGRLYCRHACGRCEALCPRGVPVNTIMRLAHYSGQGLAGLAAAEYAALPGPRAENCAACSGPCQEGCPHGVPVHGLLTLAHEDLA